MRRNGIFTLILAACCAAALASPASAGTASQLAKIKSLAGDWEGTGPDGKAIMKTTFRETAAGSGVIETQHHGPEAAEMITVYSLDGDDLMLTHFCMAGNAPRMRATKASTDGKVLEFAFMDATNMAKSSEGHMDHLRIVFQDPDHFIQEWTWTANGKSEPKKIQFVRMKK